MAAPSYPALASATESLLQAQRQLLKHLQTVPNSPRPMLQTLLAIEILGWVLEEEAIELATLGSSSP